MYRPPLLEYTTCYTCAYFLLWKDENWGYCKRFDFDSVHSWQGCIYHADTNVLNISDIPETMPGRWADEQRIKKEYKLKPINRYCFGLNKQYAHLAPRTEYLFKNSKTRIVWQGDVFVKVME